MRNVKVNIYKFDELSEVTKQKVLDKFVELSYNYLNHTAIKNSLDKFCEIFGIKYKINFLYPSHNKIYFSLDNKILNLSGKSLAEYILKNYKKNLFRSGYFSKSGKSKKPKIILSNDCVLTGSRYDNDLLYPLYFFLARPYDIKFKDLLKRCIYSLCNAVTKDIEYLQSEEGIIETIKNNGYEFFENGEIIPMKMRQLEIKSI